jgi:hypothetical protein
MCKIHTLSSGATLISLSPGHGFRFSDGTEAEAQDKAVCDRFTLVRQLTKVGEIKGMALNQVKMLLSDEQQAALREIATKADLVVLPFPVLSALREQGIRDQFPNCVAFNATPETMRSPPAEKIVDINNWSY